jgi:hypothetical protein
MEALGKLFDKKNYEDLFKHKWFVIFIILTSLFAYSYVIPSFILTAFGRHMGGGRLRVV